MKIRRGLYMTFTLKEVGILMWVGWWGGEHGGSLGLDLYLQYCNAILSIKIARLSMCSMVNLISDQLVMGIMSTCIYKYTPSYGLL